MVFTFVQPEIKTVALIFAERDIRNLLLYWVSNGKAHMSMRDANLITDLDATTMAWQSTPGRGRVICSEGCHSK